MPAKDEDMQASMQHRPHDRTHDTAPADPAVPSREARRRVVLELVSKGGIKSQYDLQDALAERGIEVNQATLSRDIRALGLLKGKDGYELPANALPPGGDAGLSVYAAVHAWLAFTEVAGTLLVLKTPVAGANPLAIAIDHAGWNEVVGTIAGDDTVFVATRSTADARRVEALLLEIKRRRG
jgi:transcriptional regulator of arginine metabolism